MYVAYLRDKIYLRQFGIHLQKLRTSKGMTQAELAYECGMEISQISRMERGMLNTSISNIYLMSKALGIHPMEFLNFEMKSKDKKK